MTTRLSRTLWSVVAAAATLGLLLSLVALSRPTPQRTQPAQVQGSAPVAPTQEEPRDDPGVRPAGQAGGAPRVARSSAALGDLAVTRPVPPTRIRVPSLDLDLEVRGTGVEKDRQMRLPSDPRVMGWYRYGPAPGARGSTVLAGHVDSRRFGIGPLAALAAVRPGATVEVTLRDGSRMTYRVDSIERFERQALPDEVFSREGRPRLRLVTCTGAFDPASGGYEQNLVVTALPLPRR